MTPIKVDFDALMQFGNVYRTLSESLDQRATQIYEFNATQIQLVVNKYDLEIRTSNAHFVGQTIPVIAADARERSNRVGSYLMSCSSDLFEHAGQANVRDDSFNWAGAVFGGLGSSTIHAFTDPIIGVADSVFNAVPDGIVSRAWTVISLPISIANYAEALETIRHNPWEGALDGIGATIGISSGLIGIASWFGAAPALAGALPYLAVAGAGIAAFELSRWATRDVGNWMGGRIYDGWQLATTAIDYSRDALGDFSGKLWDGANDLWDGATSLGSGLWDSVISQSNLPNPHWQMASSLIEHIRVPLGELPGVLDGTPGGVGTTWHNPIGFGPWFWGDVLKPENPSEGDEPGVGAWAPLIGGALEAIRRAGEDLAEASGTSAGSGPDTPVRPETKPGRDDIVDGYPNADAVAHPGVYEWWVDENSDGAKQVTPNQHDNDELVSSRGYYYRNCTDYVAWKLESQGVPFTDYSGNGHASLWNDRNPTKVSTTPGPGMVAVFESGRYGHVAFVERVNADGTITISEYNQEGTGEFGTRTMRPADLGVTNYVDFGITNYHP